MTGHSVATRQKISLSATTGMYTTLREIKPKTQHPCAWRVSADLGSGGREACFFPLLVLLALTLVAAHPKSVPETAHRWRRYPAKFPRIGNLQSCDGTLR
eukprot:1836686-Rhodomonas_salina.1